MKFKVTEMMLECVDDYMARNGTNEEARVGLKSHFPKLTKAQIATVLKEWYKQMEEV